MHAKKLNLLWHFLHSTFFILCWRKLSNVHVAMPKKSYQWREIPEEVMCTSNNNENLNAEPHYEFCQTHLIEYNAYNSDGTLSAICWLTSRECTQTEPHSEVKCSTISCLPSKFYTKRWNNMSCVFKFLFAPSPSPSQVTSEASDKFSFNFPVWN